MSQAERPTTGSMLWCRNSVKEWLRELGTVKREIRVGTLGDEVKGDM